MNFSPTPEQVAALDAFKTGQNLVLEAGAGTGKTSTLRLMAESTDRKGLYMAYNKAIQLDAEASFPSNVKCKTAHSLAFGAILFGQGYKDRFDRTKGRQSSKAVAQILGITQSLKLDDEHTLDPRGIAVLARQTVAEFSNSADEKISQRHVPAVAGAEAHAATIAATVVPFAIAAWSDITSKTGRLTMSHDHYLKMWQLTHPKLRVDYILYDEAQDANPVIAAVVQGQDCQQIVVGDRSQAIYGWRGAVDAMSDFKADHRLALTQSFRFGHAVAAEANKWLTVLGTKVNGADFRLQGFEKINSTVEALSAPHAVLCRTNATTIAEALHYQEQGKKVAIVGGAAKIMAFANAANDLMQGSKTDHEELCAFNSWMEVQQYAQSDEGTDLRTMVKLIDTHGTHAILEIGRNCVDEKKQTPDVVVSTAHKAKGREWDTVRIANDFPEPKEGAEKISRTEAMLAYVAVTRAKKILDNAGLSWVEAWLVSEVTA